MKDNEIINALENCKFGGTCDDCTFSGNRNCINLLHYACLELINRQKAEIETLQYCNRVNISSVAELHDRLITAKAEAVKEFAEKSKEIVDYIVELLFRDDVEQCQVKDCHKPVSISCGSEICVQENKEIWHKKINNLVKEMVGE